MAEQLYLSIVDYVVFALVLAISAFIGIYFAFCGGKQKTTQEFLLADRQMSVVPVSLSLLASFMSAITLLGTPSEIYRYGTQYWMIWIGYIITMTLASLVYVPIFYRLKLTSVFEYIEMRFNRPLRLVACFIQILQMVMYMAIVLYAPCLALNAVTGLNLWASVVAVGAVCTFYTAIGGIKAVMWTDSFQMVMVFVGLSAILIKGGIDHGGYTNLFNILDEGERVQFFNFDPDPTVRHTVWGLVLGGSMTWLSVYGVNQAQVQRALTCKTLRQAQFALWINVPGLTGLLTVCALAGVVCYAQFRDCDPLSSGRIDAPDQLLPLYVMEALGHLKGLPGLFTAAIFSGALSTISSGLNSLSAITLEDYVKALWFKDLSEYKATIISKCLAVIYGVICVALTVVAANLGGVLQAALALFGMLGGPQLGLYSLGMLFPCANKIGAMSGFASGLIFTLWMGLGQQFYGAPNEQLPTSMEGCNITHSPYSAYTTAPQSIVTDAELALGPEDKAGYVAIYAVSYIWYSAISVGVVLLVGLVVSAFTGCNRDEKVDGKLICPVFDVFCPYLPARVLDVLHCGVSHPQDKWDEEKEMQVEEKPPPYSAVGHLNQAYYIEPSAYISDPTHSNTQTSTTNM